MFKITLSLLLSSTLIYGQGFTFRDTAFLGASSSAPVFSPTDVGGLALYLNYTDLSAGSVTTWTDRISGRAFTMSGAGRRPSKDSNGVLFNIAGNSALTNFPQVSYTNCTVWIGFKMSTANTSFKSLISDNTDSQGMMQGNLSNGSMIWYPRSSSTMFNAVAGVYYDWVLLKTNGATINTKGFTNGVATADSAGIATPVNLSYIGNDFADEAYDGYIKFIAIWTNKFLTATDAANLHTYSLSH